VSLIAVSRFEAAVFERYGGLKDKPVAVIRNGGTLPSSVSGTDVVPGRIVSVGRLERYKGHQHVIEALPHVIRKVPEAHLLILGNGPYEDHLRKFADQLGVSSQVRIRYIASSDRLGMATALAESSVVAALSDYEAHPVAVMEALSVLRPVVGCDTAGVGELVAKGWVRGVPPGSSAAVVAQELVTAMSSPSLAIDTQLPTWDSCADQLAHIYLSSLGINAENQVQPRPDATAAGPVAMAPTRYHKGVERQIQSWRSPR
jgi:glycosyltransferase involved in cell wall biosynthesis